MTLQTVGVQVVAEGVSKATSEIDKFARAVESSSNSVDGFEDSLSSASKATGNYLDKNGRLRNSLGQYVKASDSARKSNESVVSSFAGMVAGSAKASTGVAGLSTGLVALGAGAVATGITGVVAGIGAIGAISLKTANDVNNASLDIQSQLGETKESADILAETTQDIWSEGFFADMSEANQALIYTRQQMQNLNQEDLGNVVMGVQSIVDAFGGDYESNLSAIQTLTKQFGITSQEALDLVATGFQNGLNGSGDFIESINEYSTQFAGAGATANEFFATLQDGYQGGILGTDKIADAFKEFGFKLETGSDGIRTQLGRIGVDFDELSAGISDGSITQQDAFQTVVSALANVDEGLAKSVIQSGELGSQFEDLGVKGIQNFSELNTTFDETEGAIEELKVQYTSFGDVAQRIGRKISTAFAPVADALLDGLAKATPAVDEFSTGFLDSINEVVGFAVDSFDGVGSGLTEKIGGFVNQVAGYGEEIPLRFAEGIASGIGSILRVINDITSLMRYWFKPNSPPRVAPNIDDWGEGTMNEYLKGFSSADFSLISDLGSKIEEFLRASISSDDVGLIDQILGSREAIENAVSNFSSAGATVQETISGIESTVGALPESIRGYTEALLESEVATKQLEDAQKNLTSVSDSFEKEINSIESTIDSLEDSVVSVSNAFDTEISSIEDTITGLEKEFDSIDDTFEDTISSMEDELENLEDALDDSSDSFDDLLKPLIDGLEELNKELEETQKGFEEALSPLEGELSALDAEKQRIKEKQRLQEIEEELAKTGEDALTTDERRLLEIEKQEIALQRQIDEQKALQEAEESAIEAKIANQEKAILAVEKERDAEQQRIQERIDAQKEAIEGVQKERDVQKEIFDEKIKQQKQILEAKELEKQVALQSIQQQIDAEKKAIELKKAERDEAIAVEQQKVDLAKQNLDSRKEEVAIAQSVIDRENETNALLKERQSILDSIAQSQSGNGGFGGGVVPIGMSELESPAEELGESVEQIADKITEAQKRLRDAFLPISEQFEVFKNNFNQFVKEPVVDFFENSIIPAFDKFRNSVVNDVFPKVSEVITSFGNNVVMPIFQFIGSTLLDILIPRFERLKTILVDVVFPAIGIVIESVWGNVIKPTFEAIGDFVDSTLLPSFERFNVFISNTAMPQISSAIQEFWAFSKPIFDQVIEFLVNVFLPSFAQFADWLTESFFNFLVTEVNSWWESTKTVFNLLVSFFGDVLVPTIQYLWEQWTTVWFPAISEAVRFAWEEVISPALNELWTFLQETLLPKLLELYESVVNVWFPAIGEIIQSVWEGVISPALNAFWSFITDSVIPTLTELYDSAVNVWFPAIGDAVSTMWDKVKPIFDSIVKFGAITIPDAITKLKNAFSTGFGAIKSFIEPVIEAVKTLIGFIGDAIEAFNNLPSVSDVTGGAVDALRGDGVPFVPGFAEGVRNFSGGLAIVGEEGRELVATPNGGMFTVDGATLLNLPTGTDVYNKGETDSLFSNVVDLFRPLDRTSPIASTSNIPQAPVISNTSTRTSNQTFNETSNINISVVDNGNGSQIVNRLNSVLNRRYGK